MKKRRDGRPDGKKAPCKDVKTLKRMHWFARRIGEEKAIDERRSGPSLGAFGRHVSFRSALKPAVFPIPESTSSNLSAVAVSFESR
ncbi:hypothetical protein B296_00015102 [Ensete ventricosum]|uniref:Uncharacterized protein n=1 Tax=Ensete ventricosum TaxID=4639 RepID=A0A427AE99_ENSVE|nr:hypothetical protein B296_00015102 [Ensete ventricosum]